MFSNRVKILILALFSTLATAAISAARAPAISSADSAAIQMAVAAFNDAFNAHDPHACAMRYVKDGDFTGLQGNHSHGWKELEEHYSSVFGSGLKTVHSTFTIRSIRFLTVEIAAVDIDWTAVGSKAADGSALPVRKGLISWVMTKRNGQWLIAVYHESEFTQPISK